MFSHHLGRALAIASAVLLSACKTFSPDGGMSTVAAVAGGGLNKSVVRIGSARTAALAQSEVARLLHAPLSADAAVQIALLNNRELQAAYNRLGIAEAVMVQASRPPLPSFSYDWVKTSIELDIERQIVASVLSLATWPARSKLAALRFEQAELRAAEETLRLAAETRRAYIRAVAARQILAALGAGQGKRGSLGRACADAHADRRGQQARSCPPAGVRHRDGGAGDGGAPAGGLREERLTRLMGLWGTDLAALLPSALPADCRACAQARRGRAGGDGAQGRSRSGAARSRGARPFVRAHAQDAAHQRARCRRHVQDAKGQRRASADGGGYNIAFEVPLYDFGRARVREAEQRYFEALNALGGKVVNARSEAREAYGAYGRTTRLLPNMSARCCRCSRHHLGGDRAAIQRHAGRRLRAARRGARQGGSQSGGHRGQARISGWPRPISARRCSAAEA